MMFFKFAVSSWGTHFLVHFKCCMTVVRSTMSSSATFPVIVRGSASMILSVGHRQLPMAGHDALYL